MRTLIREGISGALIREGISVVGLITQCPMWRAHEDMSRELTLVFLEGVASRSPRGMPCVTKFLQIILLYELS